MAVTNNHPKSGLGKMLALTLGALGVVYGDIGTSPLYAINEIFFGHSHTIINQVNVIGAIGLVFWAITIVISFKYVVYVLRADNEGEGGVFALYNLLVKNKRTGKLVGIAGLLIFASGLLFGDGMITPAISVISAIEGLKIATDSLIPYVVPITLIILTGLFSIQKYGTHKVGKIFGPIVLIWFFLISILGFIQIIKYPLILAALNPHYAISFILKTHTHQLLLVLGSVMLVITGGEAMYADLGHFGKKPIRLSWFSVVYPALILNYLGQGAYLLSGSKIINENIFYSMTPSIILFPTIIIATLATIIASQALISGAFSLANQAINLGLIPRLFVTHTHEEHEGQIYIPTINWFLFAGCVFFVVVFRSSANLASAYGLAVSGVMFITTLSLLGVSRYLWNWNKAKIILILIPLLILDLLFIAANSLKFLSGGFIPLIIALGFYITMKTWQWGRNQVNSELMKHTTMMISDLIKIKKRSDTFIPRSIIILTPFKVASLSDRVPPIKQIFLERYGILPRHLLFLTISSSREPYAKQHRYETVKFFNDPEKGSISSLFLEYGFMENPNVEKTLHKLDMKHIIEIEDDPKDWLIHISRAKLIYPKNSGLFSKLRFTLLDLMFRVFNFSDYFFGVGNEIKVTMEIVPALLK